MSVTRNVARKWALQARTSWLPLWLPLSPHRDFTGCLAFFPSRAAFGQWMPLIAAALSSKPLVQFELAPTNGAIELLASPPTPTQDFSGGAA